MLTQTPTKVNYPVPDPHHPKYVPPVLLQKSPPTSQRAWQLPAQVRSGSSTGFWYQRFAINPQTEDKRGHFPRNPAAWLQLTHEEVGTEKENTESWLIMYLKNYDEFSVLHTGYKVLQTGRQLVTPDMWNCFGEFGQIHQPEEFHLHKGIVPTCVLGLSYQ